MNPPPLCKQLPICLYISIIYCIHKRFRSIVTTRYKTSHFPIYRHGHLWMIVSTNLGHCHSMLCFFNGLLLQWSSQRSTRGSVGEGGHLVLRLPGFVCRKAKEIGPILFEKRNEMNEKFSFKKGVTLWLHSRRVKFFWVYCIKHVHESWD